jgi:acyl-CoA synthetase (AMP-forming)/AMP-acid ligase II
VNVLPVLFVGGAVVIPERPEPDEILQLIEQQRVTIGFGNPDLLEALTRLPRWPTTDFSSLRLYITGGAPVPERLIRAYMRRGVTFLQGYGLSEAAPLVLLLDARSALRKVGSAGKPPATAVSNVTRRRPRARRNTRDTVATVPACSVSRARLVRRIASSLASKTSRGFRFAKWRSATQRARGRTLAGARSTRPRVDRLHRSRCQTTTHLIVMRRLPLNTRPSTADATAAASACPTRPTTLASPWR